MPIEIVIDGNAHISAIAAEQIKRDWVLVWQKSGLDSKRANPHILFKADQVKVPQGTIKAETVKKPPPPPPPKLVQIPPPKPPPPKSLSPGSLPKIGPGSTPSPGLPGFTPGSKKPLPTPPPPKSKPPGGTQPGTTTTPGSTTTPPPQPPQPPPKPEEAQVLEDKPKTETGGTEQKHTFVTPVRKLELRIRMVDSKLQPLKDMAYNISINGKVLQGRTKPDGSIEGEIPPGSQQGRLTFYYQEPPPTTSTGQQAQGPPKAHEIKYELQIGKLNPIREPSPDDFCYSGVQARLNNLGFLCGEVDGLDGPLTQGAIKRFQRFFKMTEDGISSADFQGRLETVHDRNTPVTPGTPPPIGPAATPKPVTTGGGGTGTDPNIAKAPPKKPPPPPPKTTTTPPPPTDVPPPPPNKPPPPPPKSTPPNKPPPPPPK